ncbi:hypothetical protein PMAYCL1PPCAC_31810, partial [Pristionchus mayeri]
AMGSWFSRRKPVSEELETLSAQMKEFRREIESMNGTRRSLLWYLSLLIFLVSSSSVGYIVATISERLHQILFSAGSFIGGILLIVVTRRIINIFYDFRVRRKHAYLDELIEKKKKLLESVKETETFKVAKEILAKYDEEYVDESKIKQPEPRSRTGSAPPRPMPMPQQRQQMSPQQQIRKRMIPPPSQLHNLQQFSPQGAPITPAGEAVPFPSGPPFQERPLSIKPIRPFAQEAKGGMEKVVDYFFGDGPNSRMALICGQCHGHNGMAFPGEYEYLAYICYMCGHFNPARKMRNAAGPGSISGLSTPMISRKPSTQSLLTTVPDDEPLREEKEDEEVEHPAEKKDEQHNTSSDNDTDQEKP